jgi:hypothetical protein
MYTTFKAFEVAFREGLNQIASQQGDEFKSDEIARLLTRGQNSVIEEFYAIYANNNEKLWTDLESIIVRNYSTNAYKSSEIVNNIETYYCEKPYNFKYPINIRPEVKYINQCSIDTTYTETTVTEYISVVPFNQALFNGVDYPIDCTISYDQAGTPVVLFNLANYHLAEINDESEKFELIEVILEELNRKNTNLSGTTISVNPANTYNWLDTYKLRVYWQRYGDNYYPECFIFVSTYSSANNKFMEIKIDNSSATAYNGTNTNSQYYLIAGEKARGVFYSKTKTKRDYNVPIGTKYSVARQIDSKKIYENLLSNPLNKPKRDRPLAFQAGELVSIYLPEKCSTSTVLLDYVRRPRPFNADLGWITELGSNLHINIVNRAVEFAMASIGDDKLSSKVQIDTLER